MLETHHITQTSLFSTDASRWNAVLERDRTAEGVFYYAVKTTGAYCRPGCSSRPPKRENVALYDTCEEAALDGYRPCKRCIPCSSSQP